MSSLPVFLPYNTKGEVLKNELVIELVRTDQHLMILNTLKKTCCEETFRIHYSLLFTNLVI